MEEARQRSRDSEAERAESIRSAYRLPGGGYDYQHVRQCPQCGMGPILNYNCSDMRYHNNEEVRDRNGRIMSRINNACSRCGFFGDWHTYVAWDGEVVASVDAMEQPDPVALANRIVSARERSIRDTLTQQLTRQIEADVTRRTTARLEEQYRQSNANIAIDMNRLRQDVRIQRTENETLREQNTQLQSRLDQTTRELGDARLRDSNDSIVALLVDMGYHDMEASRTAIHNVRSQMAADAPHDTVRMAVIERLIVSNA